MQTIPMIMQSLVAEASTHGAVAPEAYMLEIPDVPPALNRLAYIDFAALNEADAALEWEDYCPAYALGLLTYRAHCAAPESAACPALESQWSALRGASRLDWSRARDIIARSWSALTLLDGEARHAPVA